MAEGWRMWAISLLTMMFLLPLLSAAPLDIAGDIKKEDVKDDNDGMHSHDENVTRGGKFFGHNRFDMGDVNISGSVTGDDVSIGHEVKIDVHGHTHDHQHREDDTVTIEEQREFSPPRLQPKGSFDECQFKTCGELCQTGVCDGHGFCVDQLKNPCEQHDCEGKSCGDPCLTGDIVGNCDIDGNCDFDIDRAFNSCDKQEAPKQEGESCGSCFCPPTYTAGDCAEGLTCVTDERIPDAPGICTRPGGREEPEEKKVVIPCGFNDDLLAPRLLPNGQKSPRDTRGIFQWKNNIVPYYFSNDDYSNEMRKAEDREFVRGVMDKFEEKTCFEFVEKSKNELRKVEIGDKKEVNEHVLEINIQDYSCTLGNEGVVFPVAGTTRLQLYLATHVTGKYPDGSKCRNEGLVIHELMHAFGVGHTHRRSDRDKFIQVILDNLKPNVHKQYDICGKCVLHKEIPYECGSIMHYGSHDNTEDFDKAVIEPLDEEKCKLRRKSLQVYDASAMDWQLINIIGECPNLNGQASPDVQSSPENYPEKLANVDRVLRGYDIMRGNPLPLKEIVEDPGIRLPIFEATYHEDSKTPDHLYLQPDGVDILNCADSCSTTFKTDQFSEAKSYQESLSNEVGFSVGGSSGAYGAKFSASASFREVSDKTSSESKIFTMSSATCCKYRAELRYNHPSLDKDFLRALEDLTEKYDEQIYLRFILYYGTHFISRVTMGSKFVHLKEISKETVSTLRQNGFDIKTAAEVSAYAVTGSVDTSSTNDKSMMDSFSSELDTQNTYTIGVKSPEDGKAKTWIQKPLTNPAPIKLELMEIVDLLDLHKDIKVSAAVKANLKKVMNDYCGILQKEELVSTCSAPGPDPSIYIIETPTITFPDDGEDYWGDWGVEERCPFPHFANKMELKIEDDTATDDTALNGIRLTCTDGSTITSSIAQWGSWGEVKECPEGKIKRAKLRREKPGSDDTSANGIRFECTDRSYHEPGDGYWGSWSGWRSCGDGSAVYGIRTRVEAPGGDDTGLNDVRFFCATINPTACKANEKISGSACMCGGTNCDVGGICTGGNTCTPVCQADVASGNDCLCGDANCDAGSTCVGGSTCIAACKANEKISGSACMCRGTNCDVGGICTGGNTCTPVCQADVASGTDCLCGDANCDAGSTCVGGSTCIAEPRCKGINNGCCTKANPCKEQDGDCDWHSQCLGDLKCGDNNCPWGQNDDCCYKPGVCNGVDNGCCTKDTPCKEADGDCDNDAECEGDLKCGDNNCPWFGYDDCCYKP